VQNVWPLCNTELLVQNVWPLRNTELLVQNVWPLCNILASLGLPFQYLSYRMLYLTYKKDESIRREKDRSMALRVE